MTAASIIPKAHSSQDDFPVIPYYPQFIPYRQFNNFIMIPLGMIGQQGLPATAVTMYGYLLKYSGKDGLSYPSQQTLAKDLDLSTRQVRNLVNILEEQHYIKRQISCKDNRIYYIFLVNEVIAGDLKHQEDLKSQLEKNIQDPGIKPLDDNSVQTSNISSTITLDLTQAVQVGGPGQASGQAEIDFLPPRKSTSGSTFILKEKEKDSPRPVSTLSTIPTVSTISTATIIPTMDRVSGLPTVPSDKAPDYSNGAVFVPFVPQERELLDRINLAHWETLFGSKLPWQIANGSHADEIEYMIYLQQNNKLKILSSPVGYLRSIHNSIPLNWKEEGLKKKAEHICRQREEAKQAQTETSKKALYKQALKQWNGMTQEEKQVWFDMAIQQQKDQEQKGLPIFRRNNTNHLWITARILFCDGQH